MFLRWILQRTLVQILLLRVDGFTGKELKKKNGKTFFDLFLKKYYSFLIPIFRINKDANEKVSISVKITAKAKDANTDPIMTKCWIATGSQQINSEADLKLSVVAEVRQVIH